MFAAVADESIITSETRSYSIYYRHRNAKMATETMKRHHAEKPPTAD